MEERDSAEPRDSPRARWWQVAERGLLLLTLLYFLAAAYASFEVSRLYFGFRLLETNLTDFSWQLELPWRASLGQWSGRDFQFPMGPAWQLLGYGAWRAFGGVVGVIGGLELFASGLALLAVGLLFRTSSASLAWRVVLGSVALIWTSAAGVASIRGLASLGCVLAYAGIRTDGPLSQVVKRSWLAASLCILAGLLSVDRVMLALASIVGMLVWESVALRFRRQSAAPPLRRLKGFGIALLVALLLAALAAVALGANPVRWLATQTTFGRSYAVNLGYAAKGALPGICVVVVAAALFLLVHAAAADRGRAPSQSGLWLSGALPVAAFAVIQPDPGHLALGLLPTVVLMLSWGAQVGENGFHRAFSIFVGTTLVAGWFVARPASWFSPQVFSDYAWARAGHGADPKFDTDLARITQYARTQSDAPCIGLPARMTAAHALANVTGPTSLALRWNAQLQRKLARDIRAARCPRFVRQIASFDHPGTSWYLGEDFLTVAELYAFERHLGPATVAMALRSAPALPRSAAMASPALDAPHELSTDGTARVPFDEAVQSGDIVRVEYTLSSGALRARLGFAPGLMYRFEDDSGPLSEYTYLYDMSVNERSVAYLAPDAEFTERLWMIGDTGGARRQATALSFALTPRGAFSDPKAQLRVHALTRLSRSQEPPLQASDADAESCAAVPVPIARGTVLRPTDGGTLFRPGKPGEAPAEAYFELSGCHNRCFVAELSAKARFVSSLPLRVETHRISGVERARFFDEVLSPAEPPRPLWVPLTGKHEWLRIAPAPGATRHTDVQVRDPRLLPCLRIGALDLPAHARAVAGKVTAEASQWSLADDARVHARIAPRYDTCLQATFMLESTESEWPGYDVRVGLVADGVEQRLLRTTLGELTSFQPFGPVPLGDFRERVVELRFDFVRRSGRGRLVVVDPALVRCSR